MSPCSSDFVLDAAFGDALEPAAQRALDQHLRECPRCHSRRQLLASQREQFLGKREFRMRRATRESAATRPSARGLSLRSAVLMALVALWLAIWLRGMAQPSADTTSARSAPAPLDE